MTPIYSPSASRPTPCLAISGFIIPLSTILPRGSICLFPQHPHSRGHFEPYREAWHLLEGLSFEIPKTKLA